MSFSAKSDGREEIGEYRIATLLATQGSTALLDWAAIHAHT